MTLLFFSHCDDNVSLSVHFWSKLNTCLNSSVEQSDGLCRHYIYITFGADIFVPHRMNYKKICNHLTFHLVPSSGQESNVICTLCSVLISKC